MLFANAWKMSIRCGKAEGRRRRGRRKRRQQQGSSHWEQIQFQLAKQLTHAHMREKFRRIALTWPGLMLGDPFKRFEQSDDTKLLKRKCCFDYFGASNKRLQRHKTPVRFKAVFKLLSKKRSVNSRVQLNKARNETMQK